MTTKLEAHPEFPQLYPTALARLFSDAGFEARDDNFGECLSRTRIGIEILKHCGIQASALPCSLLVGNSVAREGVMSGRPMAFWPPGAATVEVDPASSPPLPNAWAAHLVVEWRSGPMRGLLDLDLDRYSRPEKGISVVAMAVEFPRPYQDEPVAWTFDGGSIAVWTPARHLTEYKRMKSWKAKVSVETVHSALEHLAVLAPLEIDVLRNSKS